MSPPVLVATALVWALLGGCATQAPSYHSSIDNVQALQRLGPMKVSLGSIKSDEKSAGSLDRLSSRAMSIESPYPDGYAGYVREALRADLTAAGKLDPAAPRAINAVLTVNRLDTSGINVGEAEVAARFSLTESGRVLYQKEHAAKHEWESSFMGPVAVQNALNNYGVTVQKLIGRLFADPEFAAALRR